MQKITVYFTKDFTIICQRACRNYATEAIVKVRKDSNKRFGLGRGSTISGGDTN